MVGVCGRLSVVHRPAHPAEPSGTYLVRHLHGAGRGPGCGLGPRSGVPCATPRSRVGATPSPAQHANHRGRGGAKRRTTQGIPSTFLLTNLRQPLRNHVVFKETLFTIPTNQDTFHGVRERGVSCWRGTHGRVTMSSARSQGDTLLERKKKKKKETGRVGGGGRRGVAAPEK